MLNIDILYHPWRTEDYQCQEQHDMLVGQYQAIAHPPSNKTHD
jgi:hypothetical protein